MKKIFLISLLYSVSILSYSSQIFNTALMITVRDASGNLITDADVELYEKEDNYLKEINAVEKGVTNKKGVLKFKKLREISYFILVRKENLSNAGGGEQIGKLEKGKLNKITVIIQ